MKPHEVEARNKAAYLAATILEDADHNQHKVVDYEIMLVLRM